MSKQHITMDELTGLLLLNMKPKDYANALAEYFEAKIVTATQINALMAMIAVDPEEIDEDLYEMYKYNLVNLYQESGDVVVMTMQQFRDKMMETIDDNNDILVIDNKEVSLSQSLVNAKVNASSLHVRISALRYAGIDGLSYSDVVNKINQALGSYSDTVSQEIDRYAQLITGSNDAVDKIRMVASDILDIRDEPEVVEYDAFAEVKFGSYTGTGSSHVMENMTVCQTINSGVKKVGSVVKGLVNFGIGLLKKLGKATVKVFDKYVMPAVVSKDFVKGDNTDEYHIDYPSYFKRDMKLDSISFSDILNNIRNMLTSESSDFGHAVNTVAIYCDDLHLHCKVTFTASVGNSFDYEWRYDFPWHNIFVIDAKDVSEDLHVNNAICTKIHYSDVTKIVISRDTVISLGKNESEEDVSVNIQSDGIWVSIGDQIAKLNVAQNINGCDVYDLQQLVDSTDAIVKYEPVWHIDDPNADTSMYLAKVEPLTTPLSMDDFGYPGVIFERKLTVQSPRAMGYIRSDLAEAFTYNEAYCFLLIAQDLLDRNYLQLSGGCTYTVLKKFDPGVIPIPYGSEQDDAWGFGWSDTSEYSLVRLDFDLAQDGRGVPNFVLLGSGYISKIYAQAVGVSVNPTSMLDHLYDDTSVPAFGMTILGLYSFNKYNPFILQRPIQDIINFDTYDDGRPIFTLANDVVELSTYIEDHVTVRLNSLNALANEDQRTYGIIAASTFNNYWKTYTTKYMERYIFGETGAGEWVLMDKLTSGTSLSSTTDDGFPRYGENFIVIGFMPSTCTEVATMNSLRDLWNYVQSNSDIKATLNMNVSYTDRSTAGVPVLCHIKCISDYDTNVDDRIHYIHSFDIVHHTRGIDSDLSERLNATVYNEYDKLMQSDVPMIFRSQLYSMQYKIKPNGSCDIVTFLAPSDPKGFIIWSDNDTIQSKFKLQGTSMLVYTRDDGVDVSYDVTTKVGMRRLLDLVDGLMAKCDNEAYTKDFDGESGDRNAFVGIKASIMKLALMSLLLTGDISYVQKVIGNGVMCDVPVGFSGGTQNGDFVKAVTDACFNKTGTSGSDSVNYHNVLIPIILTSCISNKSSVMPFVYSATSNYGIFLPYGESAKLGKAKWHIRDDEEVAKATAQVWDTIVAAVIIIAAVILIGAAVIKLKNFIKLKMTQVKANQRVNDLSQNEMIKRQQSLNKQMSDDKSELKALKKISNPTPNDLEAIKYYERRISDAKAELKDISKNFKISFKTSKRLNKRLKLLQKVGSVSAPDPVQNKVEEVSQSLNEPLDDPDDVINENDNEVVLEQIAKVLAKL